MNTILKRVLSIALGILIFAAGMLGGYRLSVFETRQRLALQKAESSLENENAADTSSEKEEPASAEEPSAPAGTSFSDPAASETATGSDTSGESISDGAESVSMATGQESDSSASGTEAQSAEEEAAAETAWVERELQTLTLEQKVGQLFVVTPEQATGYGQVTQAGDATRSAVSAYAVGGFIYQEQNLIDPEQTRTMLKNTKAIYSSLGLPLPILTLDEEGGSVTRIAKNSAFAVTAFPSMREIGASGDAEKAAELGDMIGAYLRDLGFNTDLAPVADVLTNPANTVVADRSFGSDVDLVTAMVRAESEALLAQGINPCLKHFPGHGATAGDTHEGYASTDKTLEELEAADLAPFADGVSYAPMIMVGHISLPNVTGDNTPASLSHVIVTDILRTRLGYDGVVITDALNMGAVINQYNSGEAAVRAIEAGNDLILMPADFALARQGVLDAVAEGRISEERLEESVRRILKLKYETEKRVAMR